MLQSLEVSEAGLLAQQRKLEIISNNLANANTPGFKRMLSTFEAVAPGAPAFAGGIGSNAVDVMIPGSLLRLSTAPDLRPGPMMPTGNRLDVAVDGEGFFVIQTPRGERYTRNGSFTLDAESRLTTRDGSQVLGEGGPIEVPPGALVEIASDGTVRASGADVGRLKVVKPARAADFTPDGSTAFATSPGANPPTALPEGTARIQAGFLEGSNTNPISELVSMITAQRIFEAGQRVIASTDETLRKVTNEIPRIR